MKQKMILYNLKEKLGDVDFDLTFPSKITFIWDSGGEDKRYLWHMLSAYYRAGSRARQHIKMAFINWSNLETMHLTVMELLKRYNDMLIVIDNADIILRDKERDYIRADKNNQYLIFGRDCDDLGVHPLAVGALKIKDRKGTFIFERIYS